MVVTISLFWGLIFFDMIADNNGVFNGIAATMCFVTLLPAFVVAYQFSLSTSKYFYFKKAEDLSVDESLSARLFQSFYDVISLRPVLQFITDRVYCIHHNFSSASLSREILSSDVSRYTNLGVTTDTLVHDIEMKTFTPKRPISTISSISSYDEFSNPIHHQEQYRL